ncbi:MAG TPA: fibronectin type III domain-containing protein, partial [Thermoanaerobaculia bacterium]
EVAWVNSTVAKVRWETDEETLAHVRVIPRGMETAVWETDVAQPERRHVLIVRGLKPGREYEVRIEAEDLGRPALRSEARLAVRTQPPMFHTLHLAGTAVARQIDPTTGKRELRPEFTVVDELDRPVDGAVVHFKVVEWAPGSGKEAVRTFDAPPTRGGKTAMTVPASLPPGSRGIAEVLVDRAFGKGVEDPAGHRLYFHPLDGEFHYWVRVELP